MGVFGAENKDGKNTGFGKYVSLRPVNDSNIIINNKESDTTTVTTSINKNRIIPTTRVMNISEQLYKRFVEHSRRFYDVESYETILENLINCYEEHNKDKHWYNTNS
jgi:hypothetical protein